MRTVPARVAPRVEELLPPVVLAEAPARPYGAKVHALAEQLRANAVRTPVPPFPSSAAALTDLIAVKDVNQAVAFVTRDPALVALLMRTANSVERQRGSEMTDVRGAILRVGITELKQLALAQISRQLHTPERSVGPIHRAELERLRQRSLVTAFASFALALDGRLTRRCSDALLVAAMFADVGKAALRRTLATLDLASAPADVVDAAVEDVQSAVGLRMLKAWCLPDPCLEVCARKLDDGADVSIDVEVVRAISALVELRVATAPAPALVRTANTSLTRLGLDQREVLVLATTIEEQSAKVARLASGPAEPATWRLRQARVG